MSTSDGTVIGATKIVDHGPDNKRFVIAILAEGYKQSELPTFATDALAFANYLKATKPYDTLWPAINIHRVDVSSTDSGADDPTACGGTGATPKTYFDATFCVNNLPRLLAVNNATALSVATAQVPHVTVTVVIANTTKYGGSGGQVATYSKAPQAIEIAVHEMGHTAYALADEYNYYAGCDSGETGHDTYTGTEPAQPNVTANKDKSTIKWKSLIAAATSVPTTSNADCSKCDPQANPVSATTVGAFEGAFYFHCGAWRPQYDCKMRTLGQPFCAVCAQAITNTISPFLPKPPVVGSVSPGTGPRAGGTAVVITGDNFFGAKNVFFGGIAAKTFKVDSETQITATSPAGNGTVDVKVVTSAGTSAPTAADQFTYAATPTPTPHPPTPHPPTPHPGSGGTGTTGHVGVHAPELPPYPAPLPLVPPAPPTTITVPGRKDNTVAIVGVVGLAALMGLVAATGVVALVAINKDKSE